MFAMNKRKRKGESGSLRCSRKCMGEEKKVKKKLGQ